MSIPKKGSRKIVVSGIAYRWRVAKWKRLGDWRAAEPGEVDSDWLAKAAYFGLGDVAEGEFAILVERQEGGSSRMRCACPAKKVDAFLGRQQLAEIKPGLVRKIVERAIALGWDPAGRGDFSLALDESLGEKPDLLPAPKALVRRIH